MICNSLCVLLAQQDSDEEPPALCLWNMTCLHPEKKRGEFIIYYQIPHRRKHRETGFQDNAHKTVFRIKIIICAVRICSWPLKVCFRSGFSSLKMDPHVQRRYNQQKQLQGISLSIWWRIQSKPSKVRETLGCWSSYLVFSCQFVIIHLWERRKQRKNNNPASTMFITCCCTSLSRVLTILHIGHIY